MEQTCNQMADIQAVFSVVSMISKHNKKVLIEMWDSVKLLVYIWVDIGIMWALPVSVNVKWIIGIAQGIVFVLWVLWACADYEVTMRERRNRVQQ